jgi:hypothetical protein
MEPLHGLRDNLRPPGFDPGAEAAFAVVFDSLHAIAST